MAVWCNRWVCATIAAAIPLTPWWSLAAERKAAEAASLSAMVEADWAAQEVRLGRTAGSRRAFGRPCGEQGSWWMTFARARMFLT